MICPRETRERDGKMARHCGQNMNWISCSLLTAHCTSLFSLLAPRFSLLGSFSLMAPVGYMPGVSGQELAFFAPALSANLPLYWLNGYFCQKYTSKAKISHDFSILSSNFIRLARPTPFRLLS
jgi:hypothetical protein